MYTPALASRRKLWMTDDWVSKHQALANILREVVHFAREAGDKAQTKVLSSEAEFHAEKDKAKQKKKASSVLGIATTKEQKVPPLSRVTMSCVVLRSKLASSSKGTCMWQILTQAHPQKYVTIDGALKTLTNMDRRFTTMGIGSM